MAEMGADQGDSQMMVARKTGWNGSEPGRLQAGMGKLPNVGCWDGSRPGRLQCLGWWWTRLKLWLEEEGGSLVAGKGGGGRLQEECNWFFLVLERKGKNFI